MKTIHIPHDEKQMQGSWWMDGTAVRLSCPECGAAQPKTERQIREEMDTQLVELERKRLDELRSRIEAMAQKKNAPRGWVDVVLREAAGQ